MSLPHAESGIPVLTEIIAAIPGAAQASTEESTEIAELVSLPPNHVVDQAHTSPRSTLQDQTATQVIEQLSGQFDALLERQLHTVLTPLIDAAVATAMMQLRQTLLETLQGALATALAQHLANAHKEADITKNKKTFG